MAEKPISGYIKLQIPAGKANPAPPVGTALGPKGINIMQFCQAFNAATADKGDTIIPVEITVYEDKTFDFVLKTPPAAVLIKEALKLQTGSAEPHITKVGTLSKAQLTDIATIKMPDLNANDVEAACKIVQGTARSMGVRIEGVADTGVYKIKKKQELIAEEVPAEGAEGAVEQATEAEQTETAAA